MKEVKTPKKPLIFYYAVAMLAVFLFNFFAMPWLAQHQIKEVDYNTFVEMVEQDKVGKVEIQEQDNRILFTQYRMGRMRGGASPPRHSRGKDTEIIVEKPAFVKRGGRRFTYNSIFRHGAALSSK